MRSTEFMSPPSRGFDLLREAALSLAGAHRDIANLINPRQTAAVRYADSALSSPSDDLASRTGARRGAARAAAGRRSHLTDALGRGFTVLLLTSPPAGDGIRADGLADARRR